MVRSGGPVLDHTFRTTGHGAPETLAADAVGLVLLLSGRRTPDEPGDRVAWSGPTGRQVLAAA